jgi:hypothetical protein
VVGQSVTAQILIDHRARRIYVRGESGDRKAAIVKQEPSQKKRIGQLRERYFPSSYLRSL